MWSLIETAAITIFGLATIGWAISYYLKDSSFADVVWGLFFVNVAIDLLLQVHHRTPVQYLVSALVIIWGFRLAMHIGNRRIGNPEDYRYAAWRKKWGKNFEIRSYFQNFLMQGGLALIISASTIVAAFATKANGQLQPWQFIGVAIWLIGFSFETIGDWQLAKFIKSRKKSDAIMQSGLWRFTRHPNYFGEVTQWWGIWIIIFSLPYGWFALISPLTITALILFVSGVPMLERKYKKNPQFQAYAKRTSAFLPMPPKA
jgi:steroid 5-alpha reductase family enzyme